MIDTATERISDYPTRAATSALPTTALATPAQDARRVRDELSLMARFLRSDLPVVLATVTAFAIILIVLPIVVRLDSQRFAVLAAFWVAGWIALLLGPTS
jgi:hypothetical protein